VNDIRDSVADWAKGIADTVTGVAKRAAGEIGGRPDLVLEGEAQQARGAVESAGLRSGHHVAGWKLDRAQRGELVGRFPPRHAFTVADHVTLRAKVAADTSPPPRCRAEIVGRADDGKGVEAMVVAIDGSTERPDGGTYHITWSLGPGRRAKESNEVIARHGWTPLRQPVPVELQPAVFA
jgi:uncharacterized protein YjbJ (UPF0337 family)